jgi:N-acyl amino acid synthase of PEP-CTERM/exosortase system
MNLPEFLNLGAGFAKHFRVRPALDDEMRRTVYRIRHAVYCEELGYEPIRDDGLECDGFDSRSLHCLLESVQTSAPVGCVRLVLADPNDANDALPFETLCRDSLNRSLVDPGKLDRRRIAEVSRLAVIAQYRRRRGEHKVPVGLDESDFGTPDRPRFPYIAAGLYLGMLAQANRSGIETLFMLTERGLAKQLARLGVAMQSIGPPVEHRGLRYPSMMSVREVIGGLNVFVRPLFDLLTREIDEPIGEAEDTRGLIRAS